jgi:hypothetical protein
MARIRQVKLDPLKIYLQAQGFHAAQNVLVGITDPNIMPLLASPAMVLAAFASELYLKCLLILETGRTPPTHHLKSLFRELTPQTRKKIEDGWNRVLPIRQPLWDAMERTTGKKPPTAFDDALTEGSRAFTELRYSHENEGNPTFLLGDLPPVLVNVIWERMPAWQNIRRAPAKEISR